MSFLVTIFWISIAILFYCYIGYGMIVFVINVFRSGTKKKRTEKNVTALPVTMIVAAYNEASVLQQKINNTLAIDYPEGLLQLIIITDGSTDGSDELVRMNPSIRLLHIPERNGKYAALKRAIREVRTPVVVFSDANAMLNPECITRMVSHYNDPIIGGVAGEKKILRGHTVSAVGEAEGIYWQYESFLKRLDADLNTVTGAAGELFSIRTDLFHAQDDDIILDDFVISMQVCLQGYKIAYEPGAYATELPSISIAEEAKRKIRISAGAYQSIGYLKKCLNLFQFPLLGFQFISRRLLRWIFCPFLLMVLAIANLMIVADQPIWNIYSWFLFAQLFFYFLAFTGWRIINAGKRAGILSIPFYFVFMNYCLVRGFFRYMKGRQTVLWEKSSRQVVSGHTS